ncbi:MAG: hypothetical protein R3F17_12155 [Planctomycetota bacterium]
MYQVDTTGSNFDTKINLFAGTGCSAICIEGDGDDDGIGLDKLIRFNVANAGDTFLFQAGGYGGNSAR